MASRRGDVERTDFREQLSPGRVPMLLVLAVNPAAQQPNQIGSLANSLSDEIAKGRDRGLAGEAPGSLGRGRLVVRYS